MRLENRRAAPLLRVSLFQQEFVNRRVSFSRRNGRSVYPQYSYYPAERNGPIGRGDSLSLNTNRSAIIRPDYFPSDRASYLSRD